MQPKQLKTKLCRLEALHNIHMSLAQSTDLDTFFQQAVQLVHEKLGFERIGLYLLDATHTYYTGTFCSGINGHLQDERSIKENIDAFPQAVALLNSEDSFNYWDNVAVWDGQQLVSQGWRALIRVNYGDETLGWLEIDGLMEHTALDLDDLELLNMCGDILGSILKMKQTIVEFESSHQRYGAIFHNVNDAIFLIDMDIKIMDVNDVALEMFGYTRDELIGQPLSITTPEYEAEDRHCRCESVLSNHSIPLYERVSVKKTGEEFPTQINLMTVLDPDGNPQYFMGIVRDLTPAKQLEQQKIQLALQNERLKIVNSFIEDASHEFRTPLTIIKSSAHILSRTLGSDAPHHHLERIQTETDHLTQLIENLTVMTTLHEQRNLEVKTVSVSALLQLVEAKLDAINQSGAQCQFIPVEDALVLRGDEYYLVQALINIVHNACRYSAAEDSVTIRAYGMGETVTIEVEDTGIGMTPDVLDHIFENFYRADTAHTTRGFGLGLPIAKKIIELHNGTIDVQSTPGEGTYVTVTIPALVRNSR